jgi:predicted GTPase
MDWWRHQVWRAIEEADAVLLLVDGRAGLTAADEEIADQLRRAGKTLHLVINKAEHRDPDLLSADFHRLGLEHLHVIAAVHNQGVEDLMEEVLAALPHREEAEENSLHENRGPSSNWRLSGGPMSANPLWSIGCWARNGCWPVTCPAPPATAWRRLSSATVSAMC